MYICARKSLRPLGKNFRKELVGRNEGAISICSDNATGFDRYRSEVINIHQSKDVCSIESQDKAKQKSRVKKKTKSLYILPPLFTTHPRHVINVK